MAVRIHPGTLPGWFIELGGASVVKGRTEL